MARSLLPTKLLIPPERREWIVRPRLHQQLDEGIRRRLVLISAPAGFGKPPLVAAWLHRTMRASPNRRVAWLSLEEEDSPPARFLAYLVAALETIDPRIGRAAESFNRGHGPV